MTDHSIFDILLSKIMPWCGEWDICTWTKTEKATKLFLWWYLLASMLLIFLCIWREKWTVRGTQLGIHLQFPVDRWKRDAKSAEFTVWSHVGCSIMWQASWETSIFIGTLQEKMWNWEFIAVYNENNTLLLGYWNSEKV